MYVWKVCFALFSAGVGMVLSVLIAIPLELLLWKRCCKEESKRDPFFPQKRCDLIYETVRVPLRAAFRTQLSLGFSLIIPNGAYLLLYLLQ